MRIELDFARGGLRHSQCEFTLRCDLIILKIRNIKKFGFKILQKLKTVRLSKCTDKYATHNTECFLLILRVIIIFFFLLDRKMLAKVLEYSDEYKVDCVKPHVDNILLQKVYSRRERQITLPIVMEDLIMCDKYGLKETRRMCCDFIINNRPVVSYEETMLDELIIETKFEILTGLIKKYQQSLGNRLDISSFLKYAKEY